jgi:arginine deiminase
MGELSIEKVNVQQETFLFNTNLKMKQAGQEIERFRQLLNQDEEIVKLRNSIRQAYEEKYKNSLASMNEVLNSVSAEREAMAAKSMREIQLLMSLYSLQNLSGN